MTRRVLFMLGMVALVQGRRVQRKAVTQDSSENTVELQPDSQEQKDKAWFDALGSTCSNCLKGEFQDAYLACKGGCKETTTYKSKEYYACKNVCRAESRSEARVWFGRGLADTTCRGDCKMELKNFGATSNEYSQKEVTKMLADRLRMLEDRVIELESRPVNAGPSANPFEPEQPSKSNIPEVSLPTLSGINIGWEKGGALLPDLVPPAGQTFEVVSREADDATDSGEHEWKLLSVSSEDSRTSSAFPNKWFAKIDGGYKSTGFNTMVVRNTAGESIFKIRLSKHKWNPFRWTESFRIVQPFTDHILYTINKDWMGRGRMWKKEEWRVWRGEKGDKDLRYYCVGTYEGYDHVCYNNEEEFEGGVRPVGQVTRSVNHERLGLPSLHSLKIHEGGDTALILATTVIMDMVHDKKKKR